MIQRGKPDYHAFKYDEVKEIRQYYFQSAAALILRHSFGDKGEFIPTFIITYDVQFLASSFIIARVNAYGVFKNSSKV